jgi:MoaA/NifB/PqqE/SkfB family radical SAM enzyme
VTEVKNVHEAHLRKVLDQDLTFLPYGPKKVICTFDQSCNLSCPTCRTKLIVETKHKREIVHIIERLESEALREAVFLLITGSGDPFGSPFFRKWLQSMNLDAMPQLKHIHLHTNGQLWSPKMWGTLPLRVRELVKSAEISIDASTSETYAINRRGGEFSRLLENLDFISRLRKTGPLEYLKISMVVQDNNFREMPGLIKLGKRLDVDTVYFSQLVNWGTFSDDEFASRAVHLTSHPSHVELIKLLRKKIFDCQIVDLGNLTVLKAPTEDRSWNPVLSKIKTFGHKRPFGRMRIKPYG